MFLVFPDDPGFRGPAFACSVPPGVLFTCHMVQVRNLIVFVQNIFHQTQVDHMNTSCEAQGSIDNKQTSHLGAYIRRTTFQQADSSKTRNLHQEIKLPATPNCSELCFEGRGDQGQDLCIGHKHGH